MVDFFSSSTRDGAREWTMTQAQAAFDFSEIGRLPPPTITSPSPPGGSMPGTLITYQRQFALDYTILEGHRFAIEPIAIDEPLLSWGLHFGYATKPIAPGDYCCNAKKSSTSSPGAHKSTSRCPPRRTSATIPSSLTRSMPPPPARRASAALLGSRGAHLPRLSTRGQSRRRHAQPHRRPHHHLAHEQLGQGAGRATRGANR